MSEALIQVSIDSQCPFCEKHNPPVIVSADRYKDWKAGVISPLQLCGGDRERAEWLITGICTPCWNSFFDMMDEQAEEMQILPPLEPGPHCFLIPDDCPFDLTANMYRFAVDLARVFAELTEYQA